MLKERAEFIRNILFVVDLVVISLHFFLVYALMLAAYIVVVTHLAGKGTGSDAMPGGAYPKPAPQPPLMLESGDAK